MAYQHAQRTIAYQSILAINAPIEAFLVGSLSNTSDVCSSVSLHELHILVLMYWGY